MADPTYRIRGIAPPDLPADPAVRALFWGWVVELGLRRKDRELAQGLDRHGKKLKPIAAKTKAHRRSAMTPDGKGDPKAPPLMPARALSRTRSLLDGRAAKDAAVFFWRFDPFSGKGWGEILAIHRKEGRDVIGLSPKGIAAVRAAAWERWAKFKAGEPVPSSTPPPSARPPIPRVGKAPTAWATHGIGPSDEAPTFLEGQATGGMSWEEWRRYFRQANPAPVAIPGRPAAAYPRISAFTWGQQGPPGGSGGTKPPKPPAKPRPPAKPKPAGAVPPPPPPPPPKPAWEWGQPIDPTRPIAERIKASPAMARVEELAEVNRAYMAAADAASEADRAHMRLFGQITDALKGPLTDAEKADWDRRLRESLANLKVLRAARDEAKAVAAQETARILAVPKGSPRFRWSPDDSGLTTGSSRVAAVEADLFLGPILAAGPGQAGTKTKVRFHTIPRGKEQRAYCDDRAAAIHLKQTETIGTAVHEWGHQIERSVPGVRAATDEFLRHRVGDEPLRKLKEVMKGRYADDEFGREDDFGKAFGDQRWYVGKHYNGASEVISMGLQKLYEDPGGFARDDPEYAAFILGILDGSLRKP